MYTRLCGIIKTNTPENPGCFCFSGKCGGESACMGVVLGKRGSGILTRLTGDARELLPAGAPPVNLGCFCFSGKCGGESACVGIVLGKRGSGILTRLTGDARELLPAGAVQPVSAGFLNPCRFAAHHSYSLWPAATTRLTPAAAAGLPLRSNVVGNQRFPPQTPPS